MGLQQICVSTLLTTPKSGSNYPPMIKLLLEVEGRLFVSEMEISAEVFKSLAENFDIGKFNGYLPL